MFDYHGKIQTMSRVILVFLVLLAALGKPLTDLYCQESAQEAGLLVDPCVEDLPVYPPNTHSDHAAQLYILDIIGSSSLGIAVFSMAVFALFYSIKGITISPLTPPPRQA